MKLAINIGYSGAQMRLPLDLVLEVERLGYDSVWTAEAYGSDAVTPLAYLAAKTTRIKLGTGIMQMPGRTPAMCAMTMSTLDQLSGGRALIGIHFIHVDTATSYVKYTGNVVSAGDWFYASDVGAEANCSLSTGPNTHLSGEIGTFLSVSPKSSDTCWTDSTQCAIGSVRLHSTCTSWSGSGTGRSGTFQQYLGCTNNNCWPIALRSDGQPVFDAR